MAATVVPTTAETLATAQQENRQGNSMDASNSRASNIRNTCMRRNTCNSIDAANIMDQGIIMDAMQ
jgi:hypothetical protein